MGMGATRGSIASAAGVAFAETVPTAPVPLASASFATLGAGIDGNDIAAKAFFPESEAGSDDATALAACPPCGIAQSKISVATSIWSPQLAANLANQSPFAAR